MFIGRKKELSFLEELYNSNKFEMLILHGRRRVGKSYLLTHFSTQHLQNTIFFTADKSSEKNNVQRLLSEFQKKYKLSEYISSIESWNSLFELINDLPIDERLTLIIDEFTYLYHSNNAFDTLLQNAIDKILKNKNIFLILCGSEVSVIEEIIDNSSKPLYGRKTADLKINPFNYLEAREFFPQYSNEDSFIAYSILGGIPLYLSLFNEKRTLKENIVKHCLSTTGYLFNEPETVLRMELYETQFYKELLNAINSGYSTFNEISTKVNAEKAKVAKYLKVLINLGIITKEIPCGEKETSRNAIYKLEDNYISFWFRFIHKNQSMLNGLIDPNKYYDLEINKDALNTFLGYKFEKVCKQYLIQLSFNGQLSFFPKQIGRWWGNNKYLKKQEEIDIVAANDTKVLICECKYTSSLVDLKEIKNLENSSTIFKDKEIEYMFFSKSGFTKEAKEYCNKNKYKMIELNDLYNS